MAGCDVKILEGLVCAVACVGFGCGGGGDEVTADARIIPNEHDLTCLNNAPTSVPDPIELGATLLDLGSVSMIKTIADTEVRVYSVDGATQLTSATSDAAGKLSLSLPTGGHPTRFKYAYDPVGYPKTRWFVSIGAWTSAPDAQFYTMPQARLDAMATALGTTIDPTKGVLEVAVTDCTSGGFPGETISIAEEPGLKWAIYGGVGVWLARATTVAHAQGWGTSNMGAVNLSPGPKTLTVTAGGGTTIGPVTFDIEPGTYTFVIVIPGTPRS